jgi:hypothetical protein
MVTPRGPELLANTLEHKQFSQEIDPAGDHSAPDLPARDAPRHAEGHPADPLELALLVAARSGDAVTVARLTELIHARMREGSGVVPMNQRKGRT